MAVTGKSVEKLVSYFSEAAIIRYPDPGGSGIFYRLM